MFRLIFRTSFVVTLIFIGCFCSLSVHAETIDTDNDGLSDADEEQIYYTNPQVADTDGDGYSDGDEIKNGFSPLVVGKKLSQVDSDSDGLNDALEIALGTDLKNPDTDGDGFKDGVEAHGGFDPLNVDSARAKNKSVKVDLNTQQLTYYLNDVGLGQIPISSGVLGMPTPTGTFKIEKKVPVKTYKGADYNLPNTKWNLLFESKKGLYLHGAYWHKMFGIKPMSHGCVNIGYAGAQKLYNFLDIGNKVAVVGKTPKGRVK